MKAASLAPQPYHLILVRRVAGSDTGTTPQTWIVTANTAAEAVKIAKLYLARIPREALHSATLVDPSNAVIWSYRDEDDRGVRLSERGIADAHRG